SVAERTINLVLTKLRRPHGECRTAVAPLPTGSMADSDAPDPVRQAIDEQMAHTLTDVIVRRTGLGAAGHPGDELVSRYASEMQQILGWTSDRVTQEVAA